MNLVANESKGVGALLAKEPLSHSGAQFASRWVLWILTISPLSIFEEKSAIPKWNPTNETETPNGGERAPCYYLFW